MRYLLIVFFLVVTLSAKSACAQQPNIVHAQLQNISAADGLPAQIEAVERTRDPAWIGYSIVTDQPFHSAADPSETLYLEQPESYRRYDSKYTGTSDPVDILMRVADGQIQQLRLVDPRRTLDAGGLAFVWISNVPAQDSVHLLESIAHTGGSRQTRDAAVFFVSLHRSPATTPALIALASAGEEMKLRENAAFWLASSRGHDGFIAIQQLLLDQDAAFRAKLTFDLTLCREAAARALLISLAQHDPAPEVRSQAEFWMANIAGKEVARELRSNAEHDSDTQVRQAAVFALSQLPGNQAATQLIRVAQTSRNPDVRRQAIFWIGQSKDPRAFDYLAQLLRNTPQPAP